AQHIQFISEVGADEVEEGVGSLRGEGAPMETVVSERRMIDLVSLAGKNQDEVAYGKAIGDVVARRHHQLVFVNFYFSDISAYDLRGQPLRLVVDSLPFQQAEVLPLALEDMARSEARLHE